MSNFKKSNQELSIKNDYQIIGFRNRLIHAYDKIDNAIVWVIIKKHLSGLRIEIDIYPIKISIPKITRIQLRQVL